MRYVELPPPPPLRSFVRCLWILEDARGDHVERVLPDGCVEIIVHYGTPMRRVAGDGAHVVQSRTVVAGQLRSAMRLVATDPVGMIGVRFEPWGAGPFVRDLLGGLTDAIVPLDALWGTAASRIEERVRTADGDAARATIVSDALMARIPPRDDVRPALEAALGWIAQTRGAIGIEDMARRLQWSRRRLERHFTASVGLPPKALCRIERFRSVVQSLALREPPRLVDLAVDAGYADQAHLAREFKQLAGLTITQYLAEQHELSDHLTGVAG